jgi:nicotinate phosphoribosyltransferase
MEFEDCTAKELQIPVIKDGKRCMETRSLKEIQAYVKDQLDNEIWDSEKRFENHHVHYLDMSPAYYEMKMDLLYKSQRQE